MLQRIAGLAIAHPRRLAGSLIVVFVLVLVLGGPASNVLSARHDFAAPGSQSALARTRIEHASGAEPAAGVLALVRGPAHGAAAVHAAALLAAEPAVARVGGPLPGGGGRTVLLSATLRAGSDERAAVDRIKRSFAGDRSVTLGGATVAGREVNLQASKDLGLAEALAFPLLAILAFLIFRGIAALLPLAVGATGVLAAFAGLRAVNGVLPLSVFALNLVIGLGLGLAVDYSLFMVSRFREELGAGRDVAEAVRATMRSAGRTVVYSAVTVAVAMSSLTVFPLRFLQSMGIGGVIVAFTAAAAALTILPVLFVLLGAASGPRRARAAARGPLVRARPQRPAAAGARRGRHHRGPARARAARAAHPLERRRRACAAGRGECARGRRRDRTRIPAGRQPLPATSRSPRAPTRSRRWRPTRSACARSPASHRLVARATWAPTRGRCRRRPRARRSHRPRSTRSGRCAPCRRRSARPWAGPAPNSPTSAARSAPRCRLPSRS